MAKTKISTNAVSLNIDEVKDFLKHIITNNRYLQKDGKVPVSIEVQGESGIGKTSSILQLANELDLNFVKLNLAQIEELGDLVGYPIRQFEMSKDGSSVWVDENAYDESIKIGFTPTTKNRMSYCPPEWIAGKEKGGILLLDDWNRADIRFIQAVMELIDRQQYISWTLPKDWHIILTSNPDNGQYLVNSIDAAQKTRFISVNLKFDRECWARWAESTKIDSRCINFLLLHPELVKGEINSRSITMFFNSISSINNFSNADSLALIQMIGEGSVGSEFAQMFTIFINNKLDQLISPDKIFNENSDEAFVIGELERNIGKGDKYRADIAYTISTRIVNYLANYAQSNTVSKDLIGRITKIVNKKIFATDITYNMVKNIYKSNEAKFRPMMIDKDLVNYIVK